MANYKNLIVWQRSRDLALEIYSLTNDFPKKELFGITSQLRRAAVSVPTNIVEGYNRHSKKDLARFIDIALGSLAETEFLLEFSKQLRYVGKAKKAEALIDETGRLLWSFQKAIRD